MTLNNYLKQFKNIAWYPSAGRDSFPMVCLSPKSLRDYGISKDEMPDCFIFTDYKTGCEFEDNQKFILDLDEDKDEAELSQPYTATIFNIKELSKISVGFDPNMVAFDKDEYYGKVYVGDVLIEHPRIGKTIAKLVYVIAENTSFAINFLLKNHIKVKYVIHSRYGHGFGGGISNGAFVCHILKELGTKYFISDIDNHYNNDAADIYLTDEQKSVVPILKEIDNFYHKYGWYGYGDTVLYQVMDYGAPQAGFFENKRFRIYNE